MDSTFYQQQRHWNYIRGYLLSASERFDNTKVSQDVSRSLRSNNIQGTLTDPNHLPRINEDFAQEVNKVMAYTDQDIGDSECVWLGWNFDQQSEYIRYVNKYCNNIDQMLDR